MKEIPLTQGKVASVDDGNFEWIAENKWRAKNTAWGFYAIRDLPHTKDGRPRKQLRMHVVIWEHHYGIPVPEGYTVDHIDRNPLNNQIDNLRLATSAQQQHNQGPRKTNTSGYKGVSLDKRCQKYRVRITDIDGEEIFLGYFEDRVEAARAYDMTAIRYYGEFAVLNFPLALPTERV